MRKTILTGVVTFAVVSILALTVIEKLLIKSEVQYLADAYKPPAIAMPLPDAPPVTVPKIVKYTVAYRDTLGDIAAKYNTPWQRIYNKNTVMQGPADLKTGEEIIIPAPDEILADRPVPSSLVASATGVDISQNPAPAPAKASIASTSSKGNLYTPGNCTWYVKSKRPDLPNNLGNADTWVIRARAQGMPTGSIPRVGAVGQRGIHVVYVERINSNGTITISEMNYRGLYQITWRTLPANYFTYIY